MEDIIKTRIIIVGMLFLAITIIGCKNKNGAQVMPEKKANANDGRLHQPSKYKMIAIDSRAGSIYEITDSGDIPIGKAEKNHELKGISIEYNINKNDFEKKYMGCWLSFLGAPYAGFRMRELNGAYVYTFSAGGDHFPYAEFVCLEK